MNILYFFRESIWLEYQQSVAGCLAPKITGEKSYLNLWFVAFFIIPPGI